MRGKIIKFSALILGIIFLTFFCHTQFMFISKTTNLFIKNETANEPRFVFCGTVYIGRNNVNLNNFLPLDSNLQKVYCYENNKIFFSYEYTIAKEKHWCLASFDIDKEKIDTIFDDEFSNLNQPFSCSSSDDYYLKNGYYYNQKIILTDFIKLMEFDIKSQKIRSFAYNEYDFPQQNISLKRTEKNINIIFPENEILLSKQYLRELNPTANKILSNLDNNIWNGSSSTEHFINGVQIIDDKLYIVCRLLNYWGETYAICFELYPNSQEIKYFFSFKTGGAIHENEFYIIP